MRIHVPFLLAGSICLSACESTLDPEKFQRHVANYAILGTNKAMVMNTQNYRVFWVWDRATPEQALADAKASCQEEGSSSCVPIAVNDVQLYNPVPGAIAAQQKQDQLNQQVVPYLMQMMQYRRR